MGGMHWLYSYNDRSELIGADRKWNPTDFVFGMQYAYAYDHIGNRFSASSGGTTAGTGLHTDTYLANALNQYTTRTNAGTFHVHGQAPTGDVVTINGPTAERYAHLWHIEIAVDNSAGAVYELTEVDHLDDDIDESGFHYVPPQIETFTHDDDGNLTQDSRWTYAWNSENRLTTMTTRTGLPGNLPRIQLSFLYDHQGRRIRKTVAEWTGSAYSAVSTNYFLCTGWNLIAELDDAMLPIRTYAWGKDLSGTIHGAGGVGGLLSVDNGSTNWFTAFDGNGNLTALVDSSDGSLDAVYEYDPYGNLLRATGPTAEDNPFRFSTKYQDQDSGLVYFGMRFYNPNTGRWLNLDPIRERGGWNLYGFVWNSPVMSIDLLGGQEVHGKIWLRRLESINRA
jgi:RHS repeat-associated protein